MRCAEFYGAGCFLITVGKLDDHLAMGVMDSLFSQGVGDHFEGLPLNNALAAEFGRKPHPECHHRINYGLHPHGFDGEQDIRTQFRIFHELPA